MEDRDLKNVFQEMFKDRTYTDMEGRLDGSVTYHKAIYNGRPVSVTTTSGQKRHIEKQRERIDHEVKIMKKLNPHENIQALVAYNNDIMVVEGFDYKADEIKSYRDMIKIAIGCMEAIKHMHTNNPEECIRHGDVRSPKILLSRDPYTEEVTRVVLGGFGSSRLCSNDEFTGRIGFVPPTSGSIGTIYDDVVSLAITLLSSYFNTIDNEENPGTKKRLLVTYQKTDSLVNLLDYRVRNIIGAMLSVGSSHPQNWAVFLQDVINSWMNLLGVNDLEEVKTIPNNVLSELAPTSSGSSYRGRLGNRVSRTRQDRRTRYTRRAHQMIGQKRSNDDEGPEIDVGVDEGGPNVHNEVDVGAGADDLGWLEQLVVDVRADEDGPNVNNEVDVGAGADDFGWLKQLVVDSNDVSEDNIDNNGDLLAQMGDDNIDNDSDLLAQMDGDFLARMNGENNENNENNESSLSVEDIGCEPTDEAFRYLPEDGACKQVGALQGVLNPRSSCCEVGDNDGHLRYMRALELVTRSIDIGGLLSQVYEAVTWLRTKGNIIPGNYLLVDLEIDSHWYNQLLEMVMRIGLAQEEGKTITIDEKKGSDYVTRVTSGSIYVKSNEIMLMDTMRKSIVNASVVLQAQETSEGFSVSTTMGGADRIISCRQLSLMADSDTLFDISEIDRLISMHGRINPMRVVDGSINIVVGIPCCFNTHMTIESFLGGIFAAMESHDPSTSISLMINLKRPEKEYIVPHGKRAVPFMDASELSKIVDYARQGTRRSLVQEHAAHIENSMFVSISDGFRGVTYIVSQDVSHDVLNPFILIKKSRKM